MSVGIGRERQFEIYVGGARGAYPSVPVAYDRLEQAARKTMSPEGYAYVAGGAGTEETMRENRAAFERWRIVPRMLRDVSTRDTAVEVLGTRLPSPFVLCPIGVLEMAHRDADVAVGRAAAGEGIPYIFSNQASRPMEEVASAMGDAPRWFQLYWSTSDDARREPRLACGALRLQRDRAHARHDHARLADPRSRPRVPAVSPGQGHRPVHERSRLPRSAPGDARAGDRLRPAASRSRRSGRS